MTVSKNWYPVDAFVRLSIDEKLVGSSWFRMIVDIQTRRLRTIEQLRAFVEGNEAVDFQSRDRGEAYGFARATLERFGYRRLGKRDKGVVLRFLVAATGISRQQMERLVRQWRDTCIEDPDVIATILEHIRARGKDEPSQPRAPPARTDKSH